MTKFFLAIVVLMASCASKSMAVNNEAPVKLVVNAIVNADSSGNVAFSASATNASTYDFDFGNGVFQTVASGTVTYKYSASGNYTVNVIAKNASGKTIAKSIDVTVVAKQVLIWSEEFNTPGAPDASKWGYNIGTNGDGWGNNELEYYTNRSSNVVVANGVLKINAIKENYSGSTYTSARLLSQNKFSFKYGKIEFKAKLPDGVGTWPALWMLGNSITTAGWPSCGEIDVMEHRGMELNKIFGTVHHPGHSGANGDGGTTVISGATTGFHKYAAEWTSTSIKFSVDDQVFYTFSNTASLPFNDNFFIILNLAIGGNFAGPVDPALTNATMEVDYVRVYQ